MRDLSLFTIVAVLFFIFCLVTAPEVGQSSESVRWTHWVRTDRVEAQSASPVSTMAESNANLPYARFLVSWHNWFGTRGRWLGLRATSALGGAVTAAFFFLIITHLIKNSTAFNLCCLGLVLASYGFWSFSTEVSPRIWALAGCTGAFYFLMLYVLRPSWIRLALAAEFWFLGLMLHPSSLWFLPVAVLMLWKHEEFIARRVAALVVVVVLPLAGAWGTEVLAAGMGLDVTVVHLDGRFSVGAMPAAAVGFFRSVVHGGYVWDKVRPGSTAPPLVKFVLIWPVALLAGLLLRTIQVSVADYRDSRGKTRQILNGLACWMVMMGLYGLLNDPASMASWVGALVPFWILIVFPFRKPDRSWVSRPRHMVLLQACLVLLFVVNFLYDILPRQFPGWHPETRPAHRVSQLGTPEDLFVVPRGMAEDLAFYGGRTNILTVDRDGRVSVGLDRLLARCRETIGRGGRVVFCEDLLAGDADQSRIFTALTERATVHRITLLDTRDDRPWHMAPLRRIGFYVLCKQPQNHVARHTHLTDNAGAANN